MKTIFLRVIEDDDKAKALLAAIHDPAPARRNQQRFEVNPANFASVPRSPFAYWVSDRLRGIFGVFASFSAGGGVVRQGMATADDFRFVRAWWGVPQCSKEIRWFPFAKGGAFSPFYATLDLVVNWGVNGDELKAWADPLYNNSGWSRIIKSTDYYFRAGLTWPLRTHKFCPQVLPSGVVISVRGSGMYCADPDVFLGLFTSRLVDRFMRMLSGQDARPQFDMGDVSALPVPPLSASDRGRFAALGRRGWFLKRSLDTRVESSRAFTGPALLQTTGQTLDERVVAWSVHASSVDSELASIQVEVDELAFHVYEVNEADRRAALDGFGSAPSATTGGPETSDDEVELDVSDSANDKYNLSAELISWAVGAAFGRFNACSAMTALPNDADPFAPLSACSPGMLMDDVGDPLARRAADYPIEFPASGVLMDDPGHAHDITGAVKAVFDIVFGADAEHWWTDVCASLDSKGHDLRIWLARSFFEHHLKSYSKSRRKAPIIWQLGTQSGRYSIWLYAHRLTRDSFFQIQNDVMIPKLAHEERQLTNLMQSAGGNPSSRERKEIAAQEALVEELRALLEDVKRVAPLWNPRLDDGVVLAMAPLWRLVPQHRPWQKELKSKWDELARGKYDWAHIAMHLWPERVVPKCANDRSLAIAHGLQDEFWAEGPEGKWKPRPIPSRTPDELVLERSSPAVKSALKALLETQNRAPASRQRRTESEGGPAS